MLAGKRAFKGEDATDVIAAVVRGEPDWSALPADTPPALMTYLRHCLHKNPKERVQDIGDMRLALEGAFDIRVPDAADANTARVAARSGIRRSRVSAGAASVGLVLLAGTAVCVLKPPPTERSYPVSRFPVVATAAAPLSIANANRDVTITPDGTRLVYVAGGTGGIQRQLVWIDRNGREEAVNAPLRAYTVLRLSPDGTRVALDGRDQP